MGGAYMNFEAQLLNKRILIVDDDVSLSKSIKEVLVSRGFKNISNAYSISEGIDIFSISKIDLIILDVMLPDGEGYLLAQYIRKTILREHPQRRILGGGIVEPKIIQMMKLKD